MGQASYTMALEYLNRNPLLHMGMIEALRRNSAELLYSETDGVLLREKRSGAYMLSASNPDAGGKLVSKISGAELFLSHQDFLVPIIKNRFEYISVHDCLQAVYTGKNFLPLTGKFEIAVLGSTYEETVLNNYHLIDSPEYIYERIESGEMFGAFLGKNLLGFIGFHEEGSMGLLHVMPEYRRMGVGEVLESFLINFQLQKGWTPFCQIFSDNEASLHLQNKLGLEIEEKHLYWLI
jgi:tRNA (guanine37-N1)-methyltransferase